MAIKYFHLIKNDLQPYYPFTVKDSGGNLIDLTGATIRCTMKLEGGAIKIDRRTAGITIANQSTNKGEADLAWQAGDTDTPGTYAIEFEITPASGGKFTLPSPAQGPAQVVISDSLDSV